MPTKYTKDQIKEMGAKLIRLLENDAEVPVQPLKLPVPTERMPTPKDLVLNFESLFETLSVMPSKSCGNTMPATWA